MKRCFTLSALVLILGAFTWQGAFALQSQADSELNGTEASASPPSAEAEPAAMPDSRAASTAGPQSEDSRPYTDPDRSAYREPTPEERKREPRLRSRVEERWRHLVAGDYDDTYEFTTPAYKESVKQREHAASFGDMVTWHLATLQDVRYDDEDQAEVVVALTLSFPLGGEMMKTKVLTPERWVYKDGEWYHTATRSPPLPLDHGAKNGE